MLDTSDDSGGHRPAHTAPDHDKAASIHFHGCHPAAVSDSLCLRRFQAGTNGAFLIFSFSVFSSTNATRGALTRWPGFRADSARGSVALFTDWLCFGAMRGNKAQKKIDYRSAAGKTSKLLDCAHCELTRVSSSHATIQSPQPYIKHVDRWDGSGGRPQRPHSADAHPSRTSILPTAARMGSRFRVGDRAKVGVDRPAAAW